jgi:glycine dehydrogenase
MMGAAGLTRATEVAILTRNYIADPPGRALPGAVPRRAGQGGARVHPRPARREEVRGHRGGRRRPSGLIDYGFHAPTVSFPVAGTVMVEPTESESKASWTGFCDAMIAIRKEIAEVEAGRQPREGNVLKHAPHTAEVVTADGWDRPYSRQLGRSPRPFVRASKFWPAVGRLNNVLGDRKLICSCPPTEDYA